MSVSVGMRVLCQIYMKASINTDYQESKTFGIQDRLYLYILLRTFAGKPSWYRTQTSTALRSKRKNVNSFLKLLYDFSLKVYGWSVGHKFHKRARSYFSNTPIGGLVYRTRSFI